VTSLVESPSNAGCGSRAWSSTTDEDGDVSLNPPGQYATEFNLRGRQRLWEEQQLPLDIVAWVLAVAGLRSAMNGRVLDVGCDNGMYLRELRRRGFDAVGCDVSLGILAAAASHQLVNADATALPFPASSRDVALAPHMLYHVADRKTAATEMRRVLRTGGRCVVVTNGKDHMSSLRTLVESAVGVAQKEQRVSERVVAAALHHARCSQLSLPLSVAGRTDCAAPSARASDLGCRRADPT
jgi:SAM-dependent methyltransferase